MVHLTLNTLKEALEILDNPLNEPLYRTCRDSVIQRFEYSIDTFWKFLKVYLQDQIKVSFTIITPREIFREAAEANLISRNDYNILLECIADRNLTSHTYKEALAQELIARIPLYYKTMDSVLKRIEF